MVFRSLTTKSIFGKYCCCPFLPNVETSGVSGKFWVRYSENTFKNETVAFWITKRALTTWKLCQIRVNEENYIFRKTHCCHNFQGLFWGVSRHLAVPNYQKYISMLSHDSGDIKNIENELITKKIQVFETRRKIYNSISFY